MLAFYQTVVTMAEPTTSNDLHDSAKECAVPANLNQLKHDLHASMTTMMSEMMSTMKDDMLQQFEDYFAPSETGLTTVLIPIPKASQTISPMPTSQMKRRAPLMTSRWNSLPQIKLVHPSTGNWPT